MTKIYHKLGKKQSFKLSNEIFINKFPRFSFIQHGNYLMNGFVGPENGLTTGFDKNNVLLRAIAEVTERRCTMLGAFSTSDCDTYVDTWDIVNNKKSKIEKVFTRFKANEIDTSGSAIHTHSSKAICNALKELYEKNSLFLFWYGAKGKKIGSNYYKKNNYYQCFIRSEFSVSVFINKYFSPLVTIFVLVYKDKDLFICGVGSNTNVTEAIDHAFEEAFLIGATRYYWLLLGNKFDEDIWTETTKINRVRLFEKTFEYEDLTTIDCGTELTIENLLKGRPDFVSELHVIFIEQFLIPNLKYVRVFTKNLFNCLPLKKNIDLSNTINQETIKLNKNLLKQIPECPMS